VLLGLRVVRTNGDPLSLVRSLARALICATIGWPLLMWSIISKRNAALYDLWLHTAVVYEWDDGHESALPNQRFVTGD
jgi:uncharacterized RDD family membrane protein YckC